MKCAAAIAALFAFAILATPIPNGLTDHQYSTVLKSADGRLLNAVISPDQQWHFSPTDSLPDRFVSALTLYEDEYFKYHPGLNPLSIARAAYQNIKNGEIVSGGSTLTMQVARLAYGNKPRTYAQKLLEVLLALKLELIYDKKEILHFYANNAPFGGNIVGIEAASWRYYERSVWKLSWAETTALAILPNDPSSIYPGKNNEKYLKKRNALLDKLGWRGLLDQDELFLAKQEPLPGAVKPLPQHAYHLVHRAMKEGHKGTTLQTTLDLNLQRTATGKVTRYGRNMALNEIHNAAAIILDIPSGNTLAYVGNVFDTEGHGEHVDVITAQRSPGSLLKPVLYAAALDEGLIMPEELLPDIPMTYRGFAPKNFDKKYRGAVPANEALISSLNVPFVSLLEDYGHHKLHQKLIQLGMKSLNRPADHYGLSLILGGAESSLWELSSLYAGMARSYQNYFTRPINKAYLAEDYRPNRYHFGPKEEKETFSKNGPLSAATIGFTLNTLRDLQRPYELNGWEFFRSSKDIAWKTGTSFGFRDAWAIGMNDRYLVGVWLGNADGEGRPGLTGLTAAAPLMFELFSQLDGSISFDPSFGQEVEVCKLSGLKATPLCPEKIKQNLPVEMTEGNLCHYHQKIYVTSDHQYRANSSCHPIDQLEQLSWFVLPPVQSWYYRQYHAGFSEPPPLMSDCGEQPKQESMEFVYPRRFTRVFIPKEQNGALGKAIFEVAHQNRSAQIFWHLDGQYLGTTTENHQMGIQATAGPHLINLVDDVGNELVRRFEVIDGSKERGSVSVSAR